MKNLLVAVGNIDIPSSIRFNSDDFDVVHLPSFSKIFEKSSIFFKNPLIKDIIILNKAGIFKADKEISMRKLYKKVVFIHLDYLILNQKKGIEWNIAFPTVNVVDNTLYSPISTVYPYRYKDLIVPSPTFWMCSSNTFNVISCITPDVLLKGLIKWNVDFGINIIDEGIFTNFEIQFWNYLASMNINIESI